MSGGYDTVFVGGGLAALLLAVELGHSLPGRVAVVDPEPVASRPNVHWSYWSEGPTPYDRYAIGAWTRARVGSGSAGPTAPCTLRLVRSGDVLGALWDRLRPFEVDWISARASAVARSGDGYTVSTDAGPLRARWVLDSACEVEPAFPAVGQARAWLNGTGVRVTADRPVFEPSTATLFDPLDEVSFAYLLPLAADRALLESAAFAPVPEETGTDPLRRYLRDRYPGTTFTITHEESGTIPLGFAPRRTAGPGHILLGTKRGLVKPSAGYAVVAIARETEGLARRWRQGAWPTPTRRHRPLWTLLDRSFLHLVRRDPRGPQRLLADVMGAVPLTSTLGLIDERLRARDLVPVLRASLPVMAGTLRGPRSLPVPPGLGQPGGGGGSHDQGHGRPVVRR